MWIWQLTQIQKISTKNTNPSLLKVQLQHIPGGILQASSLHELGEQLLGPHVSQQT